MADRQAEILGEVRRILADELAQAGPVEPGQTLAGDLGVDSVGAIVLAVGLEDRFRVTLAEADAGAIVTVADLVALVDRSLAAQQPAAAVPAAPGEGA